MSVFGNFKNWVEAEWTKVFNAAPKIEQITDTVLKYAVPAISIIVGAEAGAPAAAVVSAVGEEAQKDLLAVSGLVNDFGPNPTAAGIVSGVQASLGSLLTAGHISNPTSVSNVTKVVNSLGALATSLTAPAPPPAA